MLGGFAHAFGRAHLTSSTSSLSPPRLLSSPFSPSSLPPGLALVTHLASRPNTIVFAGARNPEAASDLHALVAKHPNRVHIVELKASDVEGNQKAVEEIRRKAGQLDVVIANAGE